MKLSARLLQVSTNSLFKQFVFSFSATVTGEIELFNAAGLKVDHETLTEANDFQVDLQSLPAGSYEIKISTAEDLWRRRILKL